VTIVVLWPTRSAISSIGTSLSLMTETKVWRSSLGVPVLPDADRLGNRAEGSADVARGERLAVPGTEDEVVILPGLRRPQPLDGLFGVVLTERSGDFVGDFEGAARLLGLGIGSGADGTPDVDREIVVVEATCRDRLPLLGVLNSVERRVTIAGLELPPSLRR
jgi:hypothetical protein